MEKELIFSLLITAAVIIFSAILGICSSLFKKGAKNILSSLNLDTQNEFDDLCEQFNSYKKSDDIYSESLEKAEAECRRLENEAASALSSIRRDIGAAENATLEISLSAPKAPLSASETLAKADLIMSKYDALFECENSLNAQREQYRALLSTDIKKDTLEISDEFAVLERELSFLTHQNDVLYEKQNELESKLAAIKAESEKLGDISSLVTKNENDMLGQLEKYRAVQLKCDSLAREIDLFEEKTVQPVSARVNALISFALKPGESFVLGEHFELKYKRGSQTLPLSKAGGGLTELAMIALRVAFSEQLLKSKVPMIFDESFIYIDKDNAKRLCRMLESDSHQILFFTSSDNDCAAYFKDPKVFGDIVFGETRRA
ncbi:hypothetical protein SDC9_86820 [bioreactor metagenome]|uniref:Uncharacterized protein n=1 Tax=bioreactor metagenome TaxID=1076179 RepID=A0A644ZH44_9ZZZZ